MEVGDTVLEASMEYSSVACNDIASCTSEESFSMSSLDKADPPQEQISEHFTSISFGFLARGAYVNEKKSLKIIGGMFYRIFIQFCHHC